MKDYTYAGQSQSFDDKQVAVFFFSFYSFVIHGWPFPTETDSVGWANQNPKKDSFGSNDWEVREKLIGIPAPCVPRTLGWGVGVWGVYPTALSKICDFHHSFLAARLLLHMFPAAKEVLRFATTFEKDFKFQGRI